MSSSILFRNKYRIESTRLKYWDYTNSGYYFVTICTKNRECWFGEIINNKMQPNHYADIVCNQWRWLENQYAYIHLDQNIVMPDHTHAIIQINKPVETGRDLSLQSPSAGQSQRPKIKSLSELIGAFKTTSSKQIHRAGLPEFIWQSRFYDRIIRSEKELNNVREYIRNNASLYKHRDFE